MKRLALTILLAAAAALAADELVETAKASKAKRKSSRTKVITNADVKKAKGTVVEKSEATETAADASPRVSLVEQYESGYRDRVAVDAKRAAAQKRVDELENDLAAIEQSYYEENDLDRRDKEIVKRFEKVRRDLLIARGELEALSR